MIEDDPSRRAVRGPRPSMTFNGAETGPAVSIWTLGEDACGVFPGQLVSMPATCRGRGAGVGVIIASGRDAGTIATDSTLPSAHIPACPLATKVSHVNATAPYRLENTARRL